VAAIALGAIYSSRKKQGKKEESKSRNSKGGRGNVDREFWQRVIKLVKEIIPDWRCKEVGYVVVLAGLLVVRTMMSIWLADVNGAVVKAIVNKDFKMFIYRIFVLFLFALPSSTVNSGI